jgi:hypothetical protein
MTASPRHDSESILFDVRPKILDHQQLVAMTFGGLMSPLSLDRKFEITLTSIRLFCSAVRRQPPSLSMALQLDPGHFFSFLILYTVGRTPWTGDQPSQGRYLHKEQTETDIHASSEIRAHDPSLRASEDSSCLRPRGHYDRRLPH